MYTTVKYLGKHVIKANPSQFYERLFSEICLWRLGLKQGLQDYKKYRILYFEAESSRGMLQQRIYMLVLNKSSLGLGTQRLFLELIIVGLVDKLTLQIVPSMLFSIWGH